MNNERGRKIGLISPCGWGNLGDAAILDAVIHHLITRLPDVELYGFTMNPEDTVRRHKIPSFRITELSLAHYHTTAAHQKEYVPDSTEGEERSAASRVTSALKKMPLLYKTLSRVYWRFSSEDFLPRQVRKEVRGVRAWLRTMRSFDCLIVSGGGQLDEFWGGPWGHPYALLRWAVIASLTRTNFIVLSVGTSSMVSWLSRIFVRGALKLADYRSFRDHASKVLVGYVKTTAGDPVVPDLAYSLPVPVLPTSNPKNSRCLVGVSPMAYCDPRVWPVSDRARYRKYLEELATFVAWLITNGHDILLFASDGPDLRVVEDLRSVVGTKVDRAAMDAHVCGPPELTVGGLLSELVNVEYVVTSRLHGVILSHILNLPVLAVSYDAKVENHMANVGQSESLLKIDDISAGDLISAFQHLKGNVIKVKSVLKQHVSWFNVLLNDQYDNILKYIG